MREYKSFFKIVQGNEGQKCHYSTRIDTYGCGCFHNCNYCYAKSLLEFRNLWDAVNPSVANVKKIESKIKTLKKGAIVRLGGMTDCFQPCENTYKTTFKTIELLNKYGIHYLIVTKSDMVASDCYMKILDKNLAHIQISITCTDDNFAKTYEKATLSSLRISAIEKLQKEGFDVAVRLSPFIPQYINFEILNKIKCKKIIIEFLRVNAFIKKSFDLDYSEYTHKEAGYYHLPLEKKIEWIKQIKGFEQLSVCEDCTEAYEYWKTNFNYNPNDCCNLTFNNKKNKYLGNLNLLSNKKIAFLSSQKNDIKTKEKVKQWARSIKNLDISIISGFQSAIEKVALEELINNNVNIIMVLAQEMLGKSPKKYEKMINLGKMLIISPFDNATKYTTREMANKRNIYVLESAEDLIIGDITIGGMLDKLVENKRYILLGTRT